MDVIPDGGVSTDSDAQLRIGEISGFDAAHRPGMTVAANKKPPSQYATAGFLGAHERALGDDLGR